MLHCSRLAGWLNENASHYQLAGVAMLQCSREPTHTIALGRANVGWGRVRPRGRALRGVWAHCVGAREGLKVEGRVIQKALTATAPSSTPSVIVNGYQPDSH